MKLRNVADFNLLCLFVAPFFVQRLIVLFIRWILFLSFCLRVVQKGASKGGRLVRKPLETVRKPEENYFFAENITNASNESHILT